MTIDQLQWAFSGPVQTNWKQTAGYAIKPTRGAELGTTKEKSS